MKEVKTECTTCKKEITISEWDYNYRLKRNKNRGIFCSPSCGRKGQSIPPETKDKIRISVQKSCDEGKRNLSPTITVNCGTCNIPITMKRYMYNGKLEKSKSDKLYCSVRCSSTGRKISEETTEKIRKKQIGISCPQRGRKGHIVSEEVRKKISNSRKGIPSTCDWDIVMSEMHKRGLTDYIVTRKPIPDAIYVEDNMLVALELEKKIIESDAKRKMLNYIDMNGYGKVIIVWYSRGMKRKEWIKTKVNPEWKEVVFP